MKRLILIPFLLLLAGCDWMVGDSISSFSNTQLANVPINVDADPGRGAYHAGYQPTLTGWSQINAHLPDVGPGDWLVVELGTNDMQQTPAVNQQFITDVVALVPNDRCLAWVTPVSYGTGLLTTQAQYEQMIYSAMAAQPCRGYIQWDDVVRVWSTTYSADGVHPNAAGSRVLACMVEQVVHERNWTGNTRWCVAQEQAGLL